MTLNEAIKHAEAVADSQCGECAEEHRQLAEWLKELKERRKAERHGHWQVVKECEAYFNECSNCKGRLWEVEPEWIFCPYCACKMDEVTEL